MQELLLRVQAGRAGRALRHAVNVGGSTFRHRQCSSRRTRFVPTLEVVFAIKYADEESVRNKRGPGGVHKLCAQSSCRG